MIQAIYDSVARATLGQLEMDEGADSSQVFMNHWFNTDLFSKITYVAGFDIYPDGLSGYKRISIDEIYFQSERHALKALNRMDTWGLRNVAFFPPANWFWVYFRGRILFITCSEMKPFEGAYKEVLTIVLKEVHRQRVRGNQAFQSNY